MNPTTPALPRRAAGVAAALFLAACLVPASAAQAPGPCDGAALETRVIPVRYKPVTDAARLADQLLGPCGAYRVPKALKMISVEDAPDRLDAIAQAIASWDLPPRKVEITVSLVMARRDGPPAAGNGKDIVGDIRGVTETLSQVTNFTTFERLGSATVLASEGRDASVELGGLYRATLRIGSVDSRRGIVQIEPLRLIRLPDPAEVGSGLARAPSQILSMELDLPEGGMHLVGAPNRSREKALFLALTVWTVDDDKAGEPAAAEATAPGGR